MLQHACTRSFLQNVQVGVVEVVDVVSVIGVRARLARLTGLAI